VTQLVETRPDLVVTLIFPTQTSITLQWNTPAENGSPVCAYQLESSDAADGEFTMVYAGPNNSATVEGLQCGSEYWFKVRAENDVSV
jgi:hypothetical protein